MAKMIELDDGNFVDPDFVFQVAAKGDFVFVWIGRDVEHHRRDQIQCKSADDAKLLSMRIVEDLNAARLPPAPLTLGKSEINTPLGMKKI